jgi:phage terminase Nu1 subunit (DNA packaging protein)
MTDELTEREVADLVARFPLPDGVPDAVLNREEMAEALDTSLPSITAWINAGMPVRQTGANGRPYELVLSHCHAWNQARLNREALDRSERRTAIEAMRLALVGGKSGNSLEALDPKQRREILGAQVAQEELAATRNRLLRREDVHDLLENLMSIVRDTLDIAADRAERADPTLSPKAVSTLVEVCDGIVDELEGRIGKFFSDRPIRGAEFMRKDIFDA